MGVIGDVFGVLFGGGSNKIKDTIEVFRPNAEAEAQRGAEYNHAALRQFASEFAVERKGWFDRFVDGLNRLPRPLMAFGTLGLVASAMAYPVWFSERMVGLALVPDPLWWLMGAIVSFYFGARHQAKNLNVQQSVARTMAAVPTAISNLEALGSLRSSHADSPQAADTVTDVKLSEASLDASEVVDNPALAKLLRLKNDQP